MKRILLVSGLLITLGTAAVNAQTTMSEKSNEFALNFFEKVIEARKDSSVIVSPLGVSFVLGMIDSGAIIKPQSDNMQKTDIYDLNGSKLLSLPQKGMYIRNGRKNLR